MIPASSIRILRGVFGCLVPLLLLVCPPPTPPKLWSEYDWTCDSTETLIQQLYTPEGKAHHLCFINPGGHVFEYSVPMIKLVNRGGSSRPLLHEKLRDPQIRNEAALILADIGDKDSLPVLIDQLPTNETLTKDEDSFCTCVLYALWHLTGNSIGINSKWHSPYETKVKGEWRTWYESNKDYLYSPSEPEPAFFSWVRSRILLDFEARLAVQPTAGFRQEHPWISYEEIRVWRDDAAYEQRLKAFCFSMILNHAWSTRPAILSLAEITDPKALSALYALCAIEDGTVSIYELVWTLEEKGDPSTLPFLKQLPKSKREPKELNSIEPRRLRAVERIRLLEKYADKAKGLQLGQQRNTLVMRCWDNPKAVGELLHYIRDPEYDVFLADYLHAAGFIDSEPLISCLKAMAAGTDGRGARARTMAHAALAKHGESDSVDYLKSALTHEHHGVRLAAAAGLWRLGRRDGFQTLIDLLDIRPIESGREGVSLGEGTLTVNAIRGTKVETIRAACKVLGEMGDRSTVEALKQLLPLNLNGVSGGGGSGTGWSGLPAAVALARLGDFSGIPVLRESIRNGDPLGVIDSGDFTLIGLKRFIAELIPLLNDRNADKRVQAAREILLLFEGGK